MRRQSALPGRIRPGRAGHFEVGGLQVVWWQWSALRFAGWVA